MSTARKIIENIWPNKKLFVRLQELLSSISNDEKKGHILLSIEKMNHSREFCQLTLTELELIYVFVPRKDRSFYECICDKDIIKSYIDFEYLLKNNPLVDNNRAIICCRPRNWAIFGGWAWPKAAQEMLWPARPGPAFANHNPARPGPPNRFCRPARPGPGPTINRERICLYKQIHGKSTYTSSQWELYEEYKVI
jgi:hypothetical protein